MVMRITLFAAITATITGAFVSAREHTQRGASDRLWDLAALRTEGLVTDDEYEHKRPRSSASCEVRTRSRPHRYRRRTRAGQSREP